MINVYEYPSALLRDVNKDDNDVRLRERGEESEISKNSLSLSAKDSFSFLHAGF